MCVWARAKKTKINKFVHFVSLNLISSTNRTIHRFVTVARRDLRWDTRSDVHRRKNGFDVGRKVVARRARTCRWRKHGHRHRAFGNADDDDWSRRWSDCGAIAMAAFGFFYKVVDDAVQIDAVCIDYHDIGVVVGGSRRRVIACMRQRVVRIGFRKRIVARICLVCKNGLGIGDVIVVVCVCGWVGVWIWKRLLLRR